jgi:hypothetical protein
MKALSLLGYDSVQIENWRDYIPEGLCCQYYEAVICKVRGFLLGDKGSIRRKDICV